MVVIKIDVKTLYAKFILFLSGLGISDKSIIHRNLVHGYDIEYYFEEEVFGPSVFVAFNNFTGSRVSIMFANKHGDDKKVLAYIRRYNSLNSRLTEARKELLKKNEFFPPFDLRMVMFLYHNDKFIIRFLGYCSDEVYNCTGFKYPPADTQEANFLCDFITENY